MGYDKKKERRHFTFGSRAWLAAWGLGAGIVGGLIGGLVAFSAINCWTNIYKVVSTDAVAIANTYIVYTTFVIAAVAAVLTIAGLIFTQHFSAEKETHLANAFESMSELIQAGDGKAIALGQEVMGHPDVIRYVEQLLTQKLAEELTQRRARAKAKVAQAQAEANFEADLTDDLSNEPQG